MLTDGAGVWVEHDVCTFQPVNHLSDLDKLSIPISSSGDSPELLHLNQLLGEADPRVYRSRAGLSCGFEHGAISPPRGHLAMPGDFLVSPLG